MTHITHINYITYIHNSYYLLIIYITHILKLIIFYKFLFAYINMVNKYYQNTKKDSENKHVKDTKTLLKKKKKEGVSIIKNVKSYMSIEEIII